MTSTETLELIANKSGETPSPYKNNVLVIDDNFYQA